MELWFLDYVRNKTLHTIKNEACEQKKSIGRLQYKQDPQSGPNYKPAYLLYTHPGEPLKNREIMSVFVFVD